MKQLTVTLMPWKWQGLVLVGGTPAQFKAFAKSYIDVDANVGEHSAGHCYVEYGKPFLLWVLSLGDIPSLVHEALHVASGVLEGRGLKWSPDSEEAYAYTVEDLMRQTLEGSFEDVTD